MSKKVDRPECICRSEQRYMTPGMAQLSQLHSLAEVVSNKQKAGSFTDETFPLEISQLWSEKSGSLIGLDLLFSLYFLQYFWLPCSPIVSMSSSGTAAGVQKYLSTYQHSYQNKSWQQDNRQ